MPAKRSSTPPARRPPTAGAVPLPWARDLASPRRASPGLAIQPIVEAAIRIADQQGLDALSMRRIASELGAGTMSLYRHVRHKDELIDRMVDSLLAEPGASAAARPARWREALERAARRNRSLMRAHSWLALALASRPPLGPNALRTHEANLAALLSTGLDVTTAASLLTTLRSYVLGAVLAEQADAEARRRSGLTESQWRSSVVPYIRAVIATGRYPSFAAQVVEGRDLTGDESFELGLQCVLDGIAARVSRGGARS